MTEQKLFFTYSVKVDNLVSQSEWNIMYLAFRFNRMCCWFYFWMIVNLQVLWFIIFNNKTVSVWTRRCKFTTSTLSRVHSLELSIVLCLLLGLVGSPAHSSPLAHSRTRAFKATTPWYQQKPFLPSIWLAIWVLNFNKILTYIIILPSF